MPFVGWRGVNRRMPHRGVNRLMPHPVYSIVCSCWLIYWISSKSRAASMTGLEHTAFRILNRGDAKFRSDSSIISLKVKSSLSTPWWRVRGADACLHTLLTSTQGEAPSELPPRKEPRYPMTRKLCGPQSRSGRFEEKKNLFPLPGIVPRNVHPVAESPSWLGYPSS